MCVTGAREHVRLLRGARDPPRALRQGDRGARRGRARPARRARAPRPRERGAGAAAALRRASCASSSRTAAASPRCTRPSHGHRGLRRRGALAGGASSRARARRWSRAAGSRASSSARTHRPAPRAGRDTRPLRRLLRRAPPRTGSRWRRAPRPTPASCPSAAPTSTCEPERRELVRSLIYPVPDPSLPFLGVHLSRHIDGEVSLGPSALLWPREPRAT